MWYAIGHVSRSSQLLTLSVSMADCNSPPEALISLLFMFWAYRTCVCVSDEWPVGASQPHRRPPRRQSTHTKRKRQTKRLTTDRHANTPRVDAPRQLGRDAQQEGDPLVLHGPVRLAVGGGCWWRWWW